VDSSSFVEVWQAYRNGDAGAQNRLVADIRPRILGLAKKRLCHPAGQEDLAQSVLLSFFANHIEKLAEIREPGDLWEIFAAITLRHCNKHNKRHYRENKRHGVIAHAGQGSDSFPGFDVAAGDLPPDEEAAVRNLFDECKTKLTNRQQAVLVGTLAGMERKEIAQGLQVAIPTVDREVKQIKSVLAKLAGNCID
jgi:DNA-directed RNA polymerase specialized sigma24 family protein